MWLVATIGHHLYSCHRCDDTQGKLVLTSFACSLISEEIIAIIGASVTVSRKAQLGCMVSFCKPAKIQTDADVVKRSVHVA